MIPTDWTPSVRMDRIICHWTAGAHKASDVDRKAYHLLVEGDANLVRGVASIALNSGRLGHGYAAHTLNCNTNSIGVSMCGMAGAVESPFEAGRSPITRVQWEKAAEVVAELCRRYGIACTPKTVLFHAEVQATLGIKQRNKWDVARLPFDPSIKGAKAVGDAFRERVAAILAGEPHRAPEAPEEPVPVGARARVTASSLNFRSGPGEAFPSTGSLTKGIELEVLEAMVEWAEVRTPAGFVGWVSRKYIEVFDGPPALAPTKPDPVRVMIAEIRAKLDELESSL